MSDSMGFVPDAPIRSREVPIGCIGAGMIMAECHLAAYKDAGFPVISIASRSRDHAATVAERWGIPQVHDTPAALIEDPAVTILDLAFPPDQQPGLIRQALKQPHIKAILAQKPLSLTLGEAIALRDESRDGRQAAVGQSEHALRPVHARAQADSGARRSRRDRVRTDRHARDSALADVPPGYDRLTLANMSVHHLDVLRFLFGEPTEIYTAARPDPRTTFRPHRRGDGLDAEVRVGCAGAVARRRLVRTTREGLRLRHLDPWRVEGTDGVAQGTIGWPTGHASTLTFASKSTTDGKWVSPTWDTMWFPHAFAGVMEQLQYTVTTGTPPRALG